MKTIRLLSLLILAGLVAFSGCKKDEDEPDPLSIVSIEATGTDLETGNQVTKDLNAATAATGVPVDAVIEVTFDREVDPATATSGNFSLGVDATVSASGAVVTITPDEELEKGTDYTLSLGAGIAADDGGTFTATSRTFTTGGRAEVVPPQEANMQFYMNFDGEFADATGNYTIDEVDAPTLVEDRFGFVESAGMFDGNGNMLDVLDSESLLSSSITVSFWMKVSATDTNKVHSFGILGTCGHKGMAFEMGGGEDPEDVNYLWLKPFTHHDNSKGGTATSWSDRINGNEQDDMTLVSQWIGDFDAEISDKWVQVVLTYDATTWDKIVYINGTVFWHENIGEGFDNPWTDLKYFEPAPENASLMNRNWGIGYYGSSTDKITGWSDYSNTCPACPRTFSGYLDDIRIWDKPLSSTEVTQLYNDEKP